MPTRKAKTKRGGAPKGNTNARRADAVTVVVTVRLTPAELSSFRSLARYRGCDFSALVRELCNAALLQAVTRGGWLPPAQKGAKGD